MRRMLRTCRPSPQILVIALLGISALVSWSCSGPTRANSKTTSKDGESNQKIQTVAVAKVARRDLDRGQSLVAEFRPYQEIDVHAKVAGYVKQIYVDVGDMVKTGQILAVLEIPELKAQLDQAA